MPDTLYYNDGKGHVRQVPASKVEKFKKYFPGATPAREEELSAIENKIATKSEQEGRTAITAPRPLQIDTSNIQGQVSLPESAPVTEVAKDVMNIHRQDPDISFRSQYGAYKENPALFRDQEVGAAEAPITQQASDYFKQTTKKAIPELNPQRYKRERETEMDSIQDFLSNTQLGRGQVEREKQRKQYYETLSQQVDKEITALEKDLDEKTAARQKLINKPVAGTRYGVNPAWLSEDEREKIQASKSLDVEEANKIATQDDIELARRNLAQLKDFKAAVKDKDENVIKQFFGEAGRRIPEALYNIGTMGMGEVVESFNPPKAGEMARRSQDLLEQYTSLHQNDRALAQDIAQSITGSLEFIAQFAATGGLVGGASKGIGKLLLTQGAKKAAETTAKKGAGKILKVAGREVSEALMQTAIMPSTTAMAIQMNAENPGSFLDSFAQSYLSNLVEVASERTGAFMPLPRIKVPASIQKLQKITGVQGSLAEFAEEQIATAGHAALGDQQGQWSDLIDPRQQIITAGVVGLMQLPYASINAGGYAAGKFRNVQQKRSINKAYENNLRMMQEALGDQAAPTVEWLNSALDQSLQQNEGVARLMVSLDNQNEFDKKQTDAILNYGLAYIAKKGLDTAKQEQVQQAQTEAQETIQTAINPETNSIILAKVPGIERPVQIQGDITLNPDGSVDTNLSKEVFYTDAQGKRQVIDPKFIDIIENVPAEDALQEITALKTAEVINSQANDEVRPYEPGEIVRFTGDGNIVLMGQIQGTDENGNYIIAVDGAPAPVPIEPRMIINDDNLRGVDNGVLVDYEDKEGDVITGEVEDMSLRQNGIIIIGGEEVPIEAVRGVHQGEAEQAPESIKSTQETPENEGIPGQPVEQNVSGTAETEKISQISPEQQAPEQADVEKQTFMQSLPLVETGKNKGQIDQSRMTPEQNIRYFEYQYGQDKAVEAARKMADNLSKRIKKEQDKLDGDPFNIALNELVENLKAQEKAYRDYAFTQMQAQTEKNMTTSTGPSVTEAREKRSAEIKEEEKGRAGESGQAVKDRWNKAEKIEGVEDVITLANGEKIPGRYVLTTVDAASPSHDVERNFAKTRGFPTNEQGSTVNDRDYENDKTAQILVQQRANKYDERAVQTPVVVSKDGVVISGNDRTMSGKLAAMNGTDKAYVDYITKYAERWGFTPEIVQSIPSPRIYFVPDIDLPYNTETFAKFNAEEKKTQSTIERAIKSSKSLSKDIVIPISQVIDQFKNLTDFYADSNATRKVLQVLTQNGIVQSNEIPRLMDGDMFSAEGRSFLETTMLGAVLQEQALREVDSIRSVRQTLMRVMPQLMRNATLREYSIIAELNNAIHLLYESKQSGSVVRLHLMQGNIFDASPAEVYAEAEKLIAIMLDNSKDTEIRTIFESYNNEAISIEAGQSNMFEGVLSKQSLLTLILNRYGQQAEITQQNGSPSQRDGQGEGDRSGQPERTGQPEKPEDREEQVDTHKQQQFDIIQASNPMQDDIHTGIRSADEILTAEEAFSYNITNEEDSTPDFTVSDMIKALRSGSITVYSSKPIKNGEFVTPSKMEAKNYAGDGKVYSKVVPISNIAWIDNLQGQYAEAQQVGTKEGESVTKRTTSQKGFPEKLPEIKTEQPVIQQQEAQQKGELSNQKENIEEVDVEQKRQEPIDIVQRAREVSERDKLLADERKQRILSEGTSFDKHFDLKPVKSIKSADDILSNIDKILQSLRANEGNGKNIDYEGYAYGGKYSKNAGQQIKDYLTALNVLPNELRKEFAEKIGADNYEKLTKWAENRYNGIKKNRKQAVQKEYRYELRVRPFGLGTYPTEGFIRYEEDPKSRFGYIVMDHKLRANEWNKWDLYPTTEIEEIQGKTFIDSDNYFGRIEVSEEEGMPRVHYYDKSGEEIESAIDSARNIIERIEAGEWVEAGEEIVVNEPSANFEVNERRGNFVRNRNNANTTQLQINWEAENGDVPAKRNETFAADATTSNVQREAGYNPDIDNVVTHVERQLTNLGTINFMGSPLTGPATIKGADDVAFLFKNLESAASEHVFLVLADDKGRYNVLYQTTGISSASMIDTKMVSTAIKDFGATKIWMVHNHPSGTLRASPQDVAIHDKIAKISKNLYIKHMPSIIINTDSGKYVEFISEIPDVKDRPEGVGVREVAPVDVYSFDRQKLYNPSSVKTTIHSSRDVALFLSQQKRGTIDKEHILILDRANNINRYFLVDGRLNGAQIANIVLPELGRSGESVIIAGNSRTVGLNYLKDMIEVAGGQLLDVLEIKQDQDIVNNYKSFADAGLLEEQAEYAVSRREQKISEYPSTLDESITHTSLAKLKNQPEYVNAKEHGDGVGAYEMVSRLLKPERIEQIKSNLTPGKKVYIIPIQQKDVKSGNVIPTGYAYALADQIGGEVVEDIYRNEAESNTGASLKERFSHQYTYSGTIPDAQAQYVIVDDNYTTGNTIISMIEHIKSQGGTVSAVSTLSASRYGKGIKPSEDFLEKLNEIPNFVKKIEEEYGKGIEYFTEAELQSIYIQEAKRKRDGGTQDGVQESTQGYQGTYPEEGEIELPPTITKAGNNDIRFRVENERSIDEAGFYSTVEDALERIPQERGTVDQMKAMLLKNGAKQAEMDWMGWDDHFPDATKKVTKADVQEWIDQNKIELQEVIKQDDEKIAAIPTNINDWEEGPYFTYLEIFPYIENSEEYKEELQVLARERANQENEEAGTIIASPEDFYYDRDLTEQAEDSARKRLEDKIVQVTYYHPNYKNGEESIIYDHIDQVYYDNDGNSYDDLTELKERLEDRSEGNTKFSQYTLPGGKNYRELLLTMPEFRNVPNTKYIVYQDNGGGKYSIIKGTDSLSEAKDLAESQPNYDFNTRADFINNSSTVYRSPHFDDANILAHIRFDDREVDGDRVLFIQEVQSDWAQQGKKTGFKSQDSKKKIDEIKAKTEAAEKDATETSNKIKEVYPNATKEQLKNGSYLTPEIVRRQKMLDEVRNTKQYDEINREIEELQQEQKEAYNDWSTKYRKLDDLLSEMQQVEREEALKNAKGVPDMPFKKTDQWVNLATRRIIKYAADNGYDRIAWTNGDIQAERYSLEKQIDKIEVENKEDGIRYVKIYPIGEPYNSFDVDKNGLIVKHARWEGKMLDEVLGKEMSDKILSAETNKTFSGVDLKVGGEGMRAFYDNIVPKAVRKLSKPFGADIENIEIVAERSPYESIGEDAVVNMETGEPETGVEKLKDETYTVQSIPVTDQMREVASQGMPLFSLGQKTAELDQRLKAATDQGRKTEAVKEIIDEIENSHVSEIEATVVNNKSEVTGLLRMMGADEKMVREAEASTGILKGVFFKDMIIINADAMTSADEVLKTWVHENFHAWMKNNPGTIVPLMGMFPIKMIDGNLNRGYRKLREDQKLEEILAFAIERVYVGGPLTRDREIRSYLDPIIKNYLDYATNGEFSRRNPDFGKGRRGDEVSLFDNQRGREESAAAAQQGALTGQQRAPYRVVLPGNERVPGTEQVKRETAQFRSVDDVANAVGSSMTDDLRKEYDVKYNQFFTRFREAWEDTFLPVKDFLDLLRKNGVEIAEYNDLYKMATHTSGKNDAQLAHFRDNYQKPISLAINELEKLGFSYRDIENYVFSKHGVERNAYMREKAVNELLAKNPDAGQAVIDKINAQDFAGITALQEELGKSVEKYIEEFEEKAGEEPVKNLWEKIRKATNYTLEKQFNTGMINRDIYNELLARYEYYVPLRGHDADTAEDVWYYTVDMGTFFTSPLLKAEGRRSRAESPFAYIAQMAHSAIVQGNKNTFKQALLRLSRKENGGLMSASKSWYENVGTSENPIWEMQSALYSDDPETYIKNQESFEERMKELEAEGMAFQGRKKLDIGGVFIKPRQAEQHEVHVYQNGVNYTIYINANPAIARSVNGANRKDISHGLRFIANITRNMAANFTTRNPLFVMTNLSRDYIYATTMILAKETPKYEKDFQANIPKSLGALSRYLSGKMDLNKESDKYMYEYLMNGAKTGFSNIFELNRVAKSLERESKKGEGENWGDYGRAVLNVIDAFNEGAENITRLSVYMTSRNAGRSILQSVDDAKNITVNFNQKGAGSSVGKNGFEQFIFSAASWWRPLYLFTNAAIQALSNVIKVANKHPGKMAGIVSSYALIGFVSPMLAMLIGGDDGEDSYLKLSDWERQNNWCIMLPNGSFLKIPLPQEMRLFHRLGDNIYQAMTGKQDLLQTIMDTMFSIFDLMPMNPMGAANASWAELSPDAIRPIAQIVTNKNFMGSQVYNKWANQYLPGYLKARTNKKGEYYAPQFMVDWFMFIDDKTGGDGVKKGIVSLNPDIANHLLRGYFGGLYTLTEQSLGILQETYQVTQTGEFNMKVRETPLRTFYADKNDLRLQSSGLTGKYYNALDKIEKARTLNKGYLKKVNNGEMSIEEYSKKTQELDMVKVSNLYERIKEIRKMESALIDMDPEEQRDAEKAIFEMKKEVVELSN